MKTLEALLKLDPHFHNIGCHGYRLMWNAVTEQWSIDKAFGGEFEPEEYADLTEAIERLYFLAIDDQITSDKVAAA